jgi:uncharacterized cupin superfamily protein
MPKLDPLAAPLRTGSTYPEPYAAMMRGRSSRRLGDLAGLTQFGANLVMLEPGAVASLRHWHAAEDEFAGEFAAWKAGVANGHRFENRSAEPASFLIVGSKAPHEVVAYSDHDFGLDIEGGRVRHTYRDGTDWAGPRE